jgi:hypothetical protein
MVEAKCKCVAAAECLVRRGPAPCAEGEDIIRITLTGKRRGAIVADGPHLMDARDGAVKLHLGEATRHGRARGGAGTHSRQHCARLYNSRQYSLGF